MNETEKRDMRRRADRKRQRKRLLTGIGNLCALALFVMAVVICMKYIKKPEQYTDGFAEESVTAHKAAQKDTSVDMSAAGQSIVRYTFERPEVREGEQIKDRIGKLVKKYPGFQDIYDNIEKYPDELLAALGNSPDMVDFVKGYLTEQHVAKGGITQEERQKDFPLFLQWDKRWGYVYFGDDIIALSGCAPTCVSMVAYALTGNEQATPDKVAAYAQHNGYYQPNVGTSWNFMTEGAREFGIRGEQISLNKNKIFNSLRNGNPVICSMRKGDFTAVGHFIVITGIKDGKLVINDPNSTIRSDMLWKYEDIESQIKNLWVFYKI